METIQLLLSIVVIAVWAVFNIAWITMVVYAGCHWDKQTVEDKRVVIGCSIYTISVWIALCIHYFV